MYRIPGVIAFSTACFFAVPVIHAAELTIDNTQGLSFGSFVAGSSGSVSVNNSGLRSAAGGVVLIPSSHGLAAEFTITGKPDRAYSIGLPLNGVVTMTGPGSDMSVDDFTREPSDAWPKLPQSGTQTLSVGGTLNAGANQTPGAYSGTFTVTVDYE